MNHVRRLLPYSLYVYLDINTLRTLFVNIFYLIQSIFVYIIYSMHTDIQLQIFNSITEIQKINRDFYLLLTIFL